MALNYTTVADVLLTLPSIGSVTTITSDAIYSFAEKAEALIDAKLAGAYSVPVSGTPKLLTMVATDLTLYRLLTRRVFSGEQANKSEWPDKYKEAVGVLDDLAKGQLQLVTASGTLIAKLNNAVPWSNNSGFTSTFNEDDQEQSLVDWDKLDDIAVSRE